MSQNAADGNGRLSTTHDPYAALRVPEVSLYLGGNLVASIGFLMKDTAILWEVYDRTNSEWHLGLVGLLQALPVILLPLLTGHVADRFDRKRIMAVSVVCLSVIALALAVNALWIDSLPFLYGCLLCHGVVRAFQQPARQSLLPQIATPETFPNAVTWGTGGFHLAQVVGPIFAAKMISLTQRTWPVYLTYAVLSLIFLGMLGWVRVRPQIRPAESVTLKTITGGLWFLGHNRILLATMSIDLFAVLLGGATALLPVFQRDILRVDVAWLGWLRAAPAMGSVAVSIWILHRRPFERAGLALLWAVAGYAVATICFGLSEQLWLTMLMLILSGACDIISVVIRHTLLQALTPDPMRGRVSAINGMFIGASNYLGDAEAGYVAHWAGEWLGDSLLGTKFSVVSGGVGSLVVALVAALTLPQLRRYGRIEKSPSA